ncbi:hypothetical protein [Endozoicomonas atrinae]|uniref:hypothetical protein n=1 Tax=Endozoicomonas atrinae TaxID=1333660 RepID=UPI003B00210C
MEKAWAIIIDDDQAACMMAIPRLFEQLPSPQLEYRNCTICNPMSDDMLRNARIPRKAGRRCD